jgi:hypothetical protein
MHRRASIRPNMFGSYEEIDPVREARKARALKAVGGFAAAGFLCRVHRSRIHIHCHYGQERSFPEKGP